MLTEDASEPYLDSCKCSDSNVSETRLSRLMLICNQANKYNVTNTYSNYSSILTYDESGFNDYSALIDEYDEVAGIVDENAGYLISQNLQDQTGRTGLAVAGWRPELTEMKKQAAEWWGWGEHPTLCCQDGMLINHRFRGRIPS